MLLSVAEIGLVDTERLLVSSFSKSEHSASGSGSSLSAAAHSCRARRNSLVMKSACSTVLRWHVLPWFFSPMKSDGGLTASTAGVSLRRQNGIGLGLSPKSLDAWLSPPPAPLGRGPSLSAYKSVLQDPARRRSTLSPAAAFSAARPAHHRPHDLNRLPWGLARPVRALEHLAR
eukprot:scaffold22509_cov36-Phaeocystis_antarctica.AAC.1